LNKHIKSIPIEGVASRS